MGGCGKGNRKAIGEYGWYHSSTYPSLWKFWEKSENVIGLGFNENAVKLVFNHRCLGLPVRAVLDND